MAIGGSPYHHLFSDDGDDDVEDGYGEDYSGIPGLRDAWEAGIK